MALLVVSASVLAEPAEAQAPTQPAPPNLVFSSKNFALDEPAACRADEGLQFRYDPGPPQTWGYFPGGHHFTVEYTVKLAAAPPAGKAVQVMIWDLADFDHANRTSQQRIGFLEILDRHGHAEPVLTNAAVDDSVKVVKELRGRLEVQNRRALGQPDGEVRVPREAFSWLNFTRSNWNRAQTVRVKIYCDAHDNTLQIPIYNVAVTYDRSALPHNDRGLVRRTTGYPGPGLWHVDGTSVDIVNFRIRDHNNPQMQMTDQDSRDGEMDGQTDDQQQGDPFPDPGALTFSDVTADSMTMSWPQREVDHYLVYWGEDVENSDVQSVQVDADTLTHTITGLKADTRYAVIVYSQDYDEVTPTAYQATAAAPASCDPSTAGVASEKARAAFEWHSSYGSDAPLFWRILNTLDADNLPAKPSAVTDETVSADYVETYSTGKGWGGWAPIVEALKDCEASTTPDTTDTTDTTDAVVPPSPTPEVSISAGSGVTEGNSASFTLTADPTPASALSVSISVSQSGDFGVSTGSQSVTIPTSGSATLTIATTNDNADEANGSVTATVSSGAGYTVSSTAGSATVAVSDDDDPPPPSNAKPSISISDASGTEGDTVSFTVTLSHSSSNTVKVKYYTRPAYRQSNAATLDDFNTAYGIKTLTFNPGDTQKTITVSLVDDAVVEGDEAFNVVLLHPTQAVIKDGEATGTIIDND